jgi:DNA-binding CsgD family transcriptional regulator
MRDRPIPSPGSVAPRLRAFELALIEAWGFKEGLSLAAECLAALIPGTNGCIYFRQPDGEVGPVGAVIGGERFDSWDGFRWPCTASEVPRAAYYPARGPYRFAGKFVNTRQTFGKNRARLDWYQREMLGNNGLQHHLRATLYRNGRIHGWYGILAERGQREFVPEETAILARALGALRRSERVAALTRYGSIGGAEFARILDSFCEPAWLFLRKGAVLWANAAARRLSRDELLAAMRAAGEPVAEPEWTVSRLAIGSDGVTLVVGRPAAAMESRPRLPPALARVADAIARGWSDKEMAANWDVPLSTVRTYVHRTYQRLGVHGRVELARLWLAEASNQSMQPPTT